VIHIYILPLALSPPSSWIFVGWFWIGIDGSSAAQYLRDVALVLKEIGGYLNYGYDLQVFPNGAALLRDRFPSSSVRAVRQVFQFSQK